MIRLVLTCGACPEQYDAFDGDTRVGYLRLRNGHFRVDYPDVGGKTILENEFEDDEWKGAFDDDLERKIYLSRAVSAIQEHRGLIDPTFEVVREWP